ncbi:MAG: DNA polymerase I [Myxococcales bacterium]|nr:DNA polymerase I [Myxococcales bacterium]
MAAEARRAHPRRLLVVDGANTLYRAFFAIPSLRAPDGTPTNAAYGFVNTLAKLLREETPDYVAIAWDPRGGSFRKQLFDGYKATRDAQPEDLTAQIPLVRELVDAHRIPVLEVEGFEADDVIATLATELPDDVELLIVSSDKDLMQLVSDRVTLLDGIKDRRYEPADVEARFGVPPERMLDLRALVGDPSDNIPGVKGIGDKGAAKLIQEWGTLEALLDHAGEVKAKRAREALVEQADAARLSKELATLRRDVPLEGGLDALAARAHDEDALRALYERLGFTRLLESLGGAAEAPRADVEVEIATDADGVAAKLAALARGGELALFGVLTDASVVDARLVGLAVAGVPDEPVWFAPIAEAADAQEGLPMEARPARLAAADVLAPLAALFADGARAPAWIGHETKRLHACLGERDAALPCAVFDTEIAAFLLDAAGARDLPTLAQQRLGARVQSFEELAGRGAKATPVDALDVGALARWAAAQAAAVRDLRAPMCEQLDRDGLRPLFDEVEMPLTAVLGRVERNGVRIDEAKLAALSEEYEGKLATIEARIYDLAGETFSVNSPKQLQHILFEKLALPAIKKTKTGFSTDESVLEQLAFEHELPAQVLAWRRLAKLKSTYLDALPPLVSPRTGRIHPTFLQTGAATGRLASTHPNVQNIPIRTEEGVRIREAFVPAEGRVLLSADYSQVELRILAHYSGDASLIAAFERGEDIHRRTAAEVAGIDPADVTDEQRARAKAVNFGIIYGSSAFGLANQLGIATGEAQATIDAYFARYQGVRRFLDETVAAATERGFVTTILGRRRYLPDLASKNRVLRQAAERMAVNTVIQGSEADLIKRAMVELARAIEADGLASRMILQVHDELVFEVPAAEVEAMTELARARMRDVHRLRVPLEVDVGTGRSWREAH